MKLKKILTVLMFSVLALSGLAFGCKDKYKDFSIEMMNGENAITLYSSENATEDKPNSAEVKVKIVNAVNENCKNISWETRPNNIVSVEQISLKDNIATFYVTALDNITAQNPSCVVEFYALKGTKNERKCELKVNVEIEILSLSANKSYTESVVADGEPYYINASRALSFYPNNTTQREVLFGLVDGQNVNGVSLNENTGEIRIDPLEFYSQNSIPSKIKVNVQSKSVETLSCEIEVYVLREITNDNITISYDFGDDEVYAFSGNQDIDELQAISKLESEGITLATNVDSMKNANLKVEISETFGWDYNDISVEFEDLILTNALIQSDESKNTINAKNYIVFSTGSGMGEIVLKIKYKNVEEYEKTLVIPLKTREYPINLVINNSLADEYNIFDYYQNSSVGEKFAIKISDVGAFDKTFKVFVSESDFEKIEIRFDGELLSYDDLISRVFNSGSELCIRAKEVNENSDVNVLFYSNILTNLINENNGEDDEIKWENENFNAEMFEDKFGESEIYKNLFKTLKLNLVAGVKSLSFKDVLDVVYLEKSKQQIDVNFVVNNGLNSLDEYVNLEFAFGSDLVDVTREINGSKFILKSKNLTGKVEYFLQSDSGIVTEHKTIVIYSAYDETDEAKFEFDLSSANIKKVTSVDESGKEIISYFIGTSYGKNSANFKVLNPQNATIFGVSATTNNNAVKVNVLNSDELLFNLYATENINDVVIVEVKLLVFVFDENENEYVQKEVSASFEISTYEPLSTILFENGKTTMQVEVVDGDGLDEDSLNSGLNTIDLNKLILINGQKNNTGNIKNIEYSYPQYLISGANSDYEILNANDVDEENGATGSEKLLNFDKIAFHVYRNHQDKFVDGKFVIPISILISDLEGGNEKYLLSLTVIVKTQVKPESVKINNENGFVYLENTGLGIGQINAEVIGENKKEATNKNLYFELISGSSVTVDENTGVVSMKSAGVSKVRVYAKGSKYGNSGSYSIYKDVYVVVADGSESYPYILNDASAIIENKYYTLNKNLVINSTISIQPAGIDGKFAYAEFANSTFDENAIYSIEFNGKNQSVFGDKLTTKLENLNVYYNQNSLLISSDFGLLATENGANNVVKNVSLYVNNVQIKNDTANANVGLMFATNDGEILNCDILNAENQKTMVVLTGNAVNFGGVCAINNGKILSSFDFVKTNNHQMLNIKIVDLTSSNENSVGGVVAENKGMLSGIKIEAEIETNAKYVGGIAGKIESQNVEFENLYFAGKINAKNTSSVVGGIAGDVESTINETNKIDFKLIFVEFLGSVNKNEASIFGNIVGGLFGNASFKAVDTEGNDAVNNRTNVKYAYSENFALLNENAVNLEGNTVGGLIGSLASSAKLEAVFSDVKILVNESAAETTNVGGAFVGKVVGETTNSLTVESAYSYSTGVSNLVGEVNGADNLIFNKVYSTTNVQKDDNGNDNYNSSESKYFFDKNNYYSNIFTKTDENGNLVFQTGNFAYLSTKNGGLPYLVYNENDGYKQLYTIVATSLNAKFIVKNSVENSGDNYLYGNNENIIVVKDNDLNKAVIYFKNNLQFDVFNVLNVNSTPVEANKSYNFESSDSSVLVVSSNGTIIVKGVGNVTLTISAKHNTNVKTYVYISVIEKVEEISVDENIVVNKDETKFINANVENKNANNGLMFELSDEISSKVLINNKLAENGKIFNADSSTFIYGRENFESTNVNVYGFTKVKFDGIDYNFVHFDTKKTINLSVVEFAKMISSSVSYFEAPENESIEFEVYVDSKAAGQDLIFSLQSGENFNEYFENLKCEKDTTYRSENLSKFNVVLNVKNNNLEEDKNCNIVIQHKINGILNENISANIDVVIKTAKLQSVELNHYSSTVTYFTSYDYIISKETIPTFEITKGNFGVLTINLFPSFANITDVYVTSSIENGNRIGFSQLKMNDNNKLVVCANKGYLGTGIKLDIDKDELLNNGGNLFVSTLLSTVVSDDTIFTITVTCFYGLNQKISSTINLNTKALTTIMLSNSNGSDELYVPKGGTLTLDVKAINLDEDFELGLDNFEFKIEDRVLTSYNNSDKNGFKFLIDNNGENGTNSIFGYKIENNQLIILSDIMNKTGLELKVTPIYTMKVNGKDVSSEGATVTIKVVDFVVTEVEVEQAESGILKNYVGNSTVLKVNLITNSCENAYYFDENGNQIESIGGVTVNGNARALELSNINIKIQSLSEQISKSNFTWNLITKNSSGNKVYNNIKENTNYTNFAVKTNDDGYFVVSGLKVSQSEMIVKVNLSYQNGRVSVSQNANSEILTEFVLNVTTFTSLDHPEPIKTAQEFMEMSDDGNYILMNDLTLPSNFEGISAKISSFDGNNRTISIQGFNISSTNVTSVGLFSEIDENTIIKNLTVNILPTFFEDDDGYYYGLNINAQNLASLNFGVLCGTNNGVITNCHVQNDNYKLVNGKNVYQDVAVNVYCSEEIEAFVGGLVGVNNGYITNSSFGNVYSQNVENFITIRAKAQIGGFSAVNNNKIASSYVENAKIYNNSKAKLTGGFVAVNSTDASVTTSYVQGYSENPLEAIAKVLNESEEDIFANGYVGGFVATNDGNVKDCYSNVCINTNKRSSGFVYDNTNGYVETSISASTSSTTTQSFRNFTGNDEENLTLNNNGIKYCYYLLIDGNRDGAEGEYDEPANGIESLWDAEYFEGFICDGTNSGVWKFEKGIVPRLVDADRHIESERVLIDEDVDDDKIQQYNYRYINNNIGTYNNPIIVRTSEEFFDALTNENNLFEYYYNGKVNKTKINYKNVSVVKDLDLSKIIDKNNIEQNSSSEVQKLQDIIFAGELNVNNMLLENLTITAKNDKVKYSSFGLFKQIGVSDVYDSGFNIENENLDEDNCSVIKNANIEIDGISATITKVVGSLSGEVVNSKLYNINVYSDNNVVVTGGNIVGGVAGRISGNSFVKGVSSNLSVMGTHENKSSDYDYEVETTKKVYKYAYDVIEDDKNLNANIVGGIFGVVDLYKTEITSHVQTAGKSSYYVEANIIREYETDFINAPVQFTKVSGDIRISGDVVGGMFGYVCEGTTIYDARFELNESNTQNLISSYVVGGIIGINKGFATYLTVETKLSRQREIDKTTNKGYLNSYLFSNENNKATFVGGLVGILKNGMLTNSYNKANISAKNSRFVGSSVGALENGRIELVYANSFVEAQSEINENGLITRQKGYAGFVGTIVAFDENSNINHAVSILRNEIDETYDFGLAGMIGYNQVKDIEDNKISGEKISGFSNFNGQDINVTINAFTYEEYISQNSSTFDGFGSSDCFVRTTGLDTFWRLTYNKKGAVREISSEDDLYNILTNGDCVLTSDIYLTKPWRPVSSFKGTFYSEPRRNKQVGQSEYYCIYNLTINEDSSNISNSVGFFISTENATISNITFVVGSNYVDPTPSQDPSVDTNPDPTDVNRDDNWGNGTKRGINILNTSVEADYSLGVLSANDKNSTLTNITIKFDDETNNGSNSGTNNYIVSTSLNKVGTLIGYATGSKVNGVSIENLKLKREAKKSADAYVGGLVGVANGGEYKNISFKGTTAIYNLQSKENNHSYIGGLFGKVSDGCSVSEVYDKDCERFEITHNAEGTSLSRGESSIYAGSIAGNSSTLNINKVVFNKAKLTVTNQYKNIQQMFVGGIVGWSKNTQINEISLSSSTKIIINNAKQDSSSNNYIGGVCGYSESGSIQTILTASTINYQDVSSQGNAYIGGVVGKNGGDNAGLTINSVVAKNNIIVKDKKQNCYVGGIVGYNVSNDRNISNTLFAGFVKFFGTEISNVGGIAGNDTELTKNGRKGDFKNFDNSFFIEDLCLTPVRDIEFGTAVKYSDFIKNINKTNDECSYSYANFLNRIKDEHGVEAKNFILEHDDNCIVSGDSYSFNDGTVFNPSEISTDKLNDLKANTDDKKYYLISSDLTITDSAINSLHGIIIGDGYKINVNKTFANEISENAIISGVIFELNSTNKDTFNGNEFVKDVQTIVADTNNGVIYNTVVKGNLSIENKQVAPVVLKNNGIINVVTSLSHIVAKDMTNNNAYASGFVVENNGVVYNSISTGNLEYIEKDGYYNVLTLDTGITNKFFGFVQTNNDIIVNCVSGASLPIKDGNVKDISPNTSFGGSSSTTTFVNCYVDIASNGYYSQTSTDGVIYETFDEIFNINCVNNKNFITNDENKLSNLWSENNEGILFGYAYPSISSFKTIDVNAENDVEMRVKTALNTTETKNNETIYLINNLSSYKFVLENLNNKIENVDAQTAQNANNESIKIKLIASFMGGVLYKSPYNTVMKNNKIQISTIKLNKSLEFDGNNFVIYGLNLASTESEESEESEGKSEGKNNSYTGLFYNDNANNNITIKNFALVDATINVYYVKNAKNNNVYYAYNNIYAGAFVAYSNAKVEILGSYASGTIQTSTANLSDKQTSILFNNATNLYVGGLVGYNEFEGDSNISNNLCELKIALDDIDATINVTTSGDNKTITKQGYDAYVGGIVGFVTNATISNNYNLGNITCSSAQALYMGGIAGKLDAGTLSNNANFGVVAYKGAYLAYYASSTDTTQLYYNVNAILGSKETGAIKDLSTNKYDSALNLATDEFVNSENGLTDLIALLSNEKLETNFKDKNKFVYNPQTITISKNVTTTDEQTGEEITTKTSETITYSQTEIFEVPEIVEITSAKTETITDETTGATSTKKYVEFKDNAFYIISLTDDFEFRAINENGEIKEEKSLTNTKILFVSQHSTTISQNIFDKLTNCTISNLTIKANETLTTSALAKQIENTTLYNINVENIYFNRTSGTSIEDVVNDCVGGVVDYAENSIFENVKVDYGRVRADISESSNVGALAGYATSSLFKNCENSATITAITTGKNLKTAGIVGGSNDGYFFHCTNNGLVYAKNKSSGDANISVAGIVNANGDYVSFCENKQNIKGVNNSTNSESENYVSGISNEGVILYSTNRANSIAISSSINADKVVANGLGGLNIYYSYHFGAVMSTSRIYTLTGNSNGKAYYSYSLGSGFTTLSQGNNLPDMVQNKQWSVNIFNADNILKTTTASENTGDAWIVKFTSLVNSQGNYDFYITHATYNNGQVESKQDNGKTTYSVNNDGKKSLAVIKLLDGENGFDLKTTTDGKTYQISNAFELWWWSCYGDKGKNVELLDDIDMTGYSYYTPNKNSPFNGTFEGNYHTISSLTINSLNTSTYWGLVGVNNGTIQNINFENPSVTITEDKAFGADNYISIVAGQNNGKIENIVVGQVSEAASNIDIQYSADKMNNSDTKIYIGTIAGQSNTKSSITNCYVINLSGAPAISSIIENNATGGFGFIAQNIYAFVGGIVGHTPNDKSITIQNNSYVSAIVSSVINNHSFGIQAGNKIVNAFLYPKYSFAYNYAGMIVGLAGSDGIQGGIETELTGQINFNTENIQVKISNNYSLTDSNLYKIYAQNGYKTIDKGSYENELEKNNTSWLNKSRLNAMGSTAKSGVIAGAKLIFKAGRIAKTLNFLGTLDTALYYEAELYNQQSVRSAFNTYGVVGVKNQEGFSFGDTQYLSQYITNFKSTNILREFENGNETYNIPVNKDFLNLSNTKIEPKNVDGKYYVYNVNEFAWAVTQNTVKNIVLMDHIDMTKKVWDSGLTLQSGLTIIDNGFKIVYGSNTNFDTAWEGKDYSQNLLAKTTSDVDDYGKFDTLTKDYTKAAYDTFESRFKTAWATAYKEEKGTMADATNKSDEIIKTDEEGKKYYYIDYPEQLEVIADALYTYTIDEKTYHKGINFYDRTFVLRKDITLPDSLSSLDIYNYKQQNSNGSEEQTEVYTAPSFIGNNNSTIQFAKNYYTTFNGTFKGIDNKETHTITIKNNEQNLFNCLGKKGTIENLIVDVSNIKSLENVSSLGVITNYGTISGVKMKVSSFNLSYNLNYIDFVSSINTATANEKAISIVPITFGLLNETNYGTITGCKITNDKNNITISPKISVDYTNLLYTYETYENQESTTKEIDFGKEDSPYSLQTSLNLDIGLYCGNNYGKIEKITVNNQIITINNLNITETFKEGAENSITYNVLGNNGLISGSNIYDSNDSPEDAGINNVNIINTTCTMPSLITITSQTKTTNTDGTTSITNKSNITPSISTTINNGLISGSSELGFANCRVFNSSITNNTTSVKTGALAGQISPSLFHESVEVNSDKPIGESVEVYSAHIPQITNCFATNLDFFGEYVKITINAREERTYTNTNNNSVTVTDSSYYYGDDSSKTSGYLDYFYYTIPSSISSGVSKNDDGSITLTTESGFVNTSKSIIINLTKSTSMNNFGKTVIAPNEITMKAYVEDKIIDGDGNTVTLPQGEITWTDKPNVKLKLTLNGVTITETDANGNTNSYNPYCFMQNGEKVYVSNDLSDIFTENDNEENKIKLELVDEKGNSCTNIAGKENVEITINNQNFNADITFDASPTEVKDTIKDDQGNDIEVFGYKIVITYQNLTTKIKMTTDQTLSQVDLPEGMSFVIPSDQNEDKYLNGNFSLSEEYYVNYKFTKNGTTYTLKNIKVIPTNNNGEPYSND